MMLIEEKIKQIVTEEVKRQMLIERVIKVLQKLPNAIPFDTQQISRHYRRDRQGRHNIINNLGGYGNPIASFVVFDYDSKTNKIHTITDKGICVIQDVNTYEVITMFPITINKIKEYWKQYSNRPKPKIPMSLWNKRRDITKFYLDYLQQKRQLQQQTQN